MKSGFLFLLFFVDWLPIHKVGLAIGPVVFVQKRYRGNKGLVAHELEHARQFWATFGLHLILQPLSRRYRAWSESKAYAKEVLSDRSNLDEIAKRLSNSSERLGLTQNEARKKLEEHL